MLVPNKTVEKYAAAIITFVFGLSGIACLQEVSKLVNEFEYSTWILSVVALMMLLSKIYNYLVS